jgi:hypothetical protein
MQIQQVQVAYHRNGISGEGFHVVCFAWHDPTARRVRSMVATVFAEAGQCAVLDIEATTQGNIAFAQGNSWRGDEFEAVVRQHIAHYDEQGA